MVLCAANCGKGDFMDSLWSFQSVLSIPIPRKTHCDWTELTTYILQLNVLIANNSYFEFSEQQLLDCVSPTAVCGYGDFIKALEYVKTHGINTRCNYPNNFMAKRNCRDSNTPSNFNFTFNTFKNSNEEQMLVVVQTFGPVIARVNMDHLWNNTNELIWSDKFNRTTNGEIAILGAGMFLNEPIWWVI